MRGSRGAQEGRTPENHKTIGFLNNTARIPYKSQSYQASIQYWAIIATPAKRQLNGVPLAGRWWPADSVIWIFSPLINYIQKKNFLRGGPPLTKLSGPVHDTIGLTKAVLLMWMFYVFFSVLCLLCFCTRLFICALWSPAGKGLFSLLLFVVSYREFVSFTLVSWVRCGTWLYRFLIIAPLLT